MRWSWLRAAMIALLIGPAPVAAEASDREPVESEEPSSGARIGHAVSGSRFYVWDEDSREATRWAVELARPFGDRRESERWRSIAAASATQPAILTDEFEAELASRSAAFARESGLSTLGCVLCLLPSLDRTCLISAWATSPSEAIRRALARAVSVPFDAVGVSSVIAHLLADPSAEVRRLASRAAATRAAARS